MIRMANITVASEDPERLAEFWSEALDGKRRELPEFIEPVMVEVPGDGADMLFKDLPKGTESDLPIHIDLVADDREEAVERLCGLGASVRETKTEEFGPHTEAWTVMEDPEGNGFCVTERESG
jgi:predicted enzyme related to lactoylglutathione lyase